MSGHVFEVGGHGRQLLAQCGHVGLKCGTSRGQLGLECGTGCGQLSGQLVAYGLQLGRLGRESCLLGSHVYIKSGLECPQLFVACEPVSNVLKQGKLPGLLQRAVMFTV